ncbi:MAG TPA: ATP-binding protein [Gemmatimonadales bacterium]|nr:ATP-binding protein [Gemmatimonadales bacterium]
MPPQLDRQTRMLASIAVGSFVAIVLAYLLSPPDRAVRAAVADVSWTWATFYAAVCCVAAARRHPSPDQRRAWWWMGAGCALFLAGQLVRDSYELVAHVPLPYPSLADAGYLSVYVCFLVAVTKLVGAEPRRRFDAGVLIDTVLVTLTAGALAYEFLLKPFSETGSRLAPLVTSIAWSIGGIAVLWAILVETVRHTRVQAGTVAVLSALAVLCVTNAVYALASLRGTFQPGGAVDLGWDAGLMLLAMSAALAPTHSSTPDAAAPAVSGHVARVTAVVIGLAGIAAVAVSRAMSPEPDAGSAILIALAVVVIAWRFTHSLRADWRYTQLLEEEVAAQTRSLMNSLAATAAAERNMRLLMDSVPDAIVVVDRDGRILESNGPVRTLGALVGPAEHRSLFDFLAPGAATAVREKLGAAFHGDPQRFDVPFIRSDGSQGVAAAHYAPIREGSGITRVLVLVRDITDQRRSESQFQQAEKLAAMGQLVSGVAHEINNPAAIISGFAQTLLLEDLKPEQGEMLQMIYDEATRIGRITSNLLAFARAGGKQRAFVDLNDLARRTFALRSYHLSTLNIALTLDLDPADPKIWADASELQQMLLNLLINAEQALVTVDGARAITVRTRADEREVRFEVADSGPGIPPEIRDKIFDPFFTTKPEGVGTGLGLSICYGIAQEHGGRIWVESEPKHGARFCIVLPREPGPVTRTASDAKASTGIAAPPASSGGEAASDLRVLVVDDEDALRDALLRFLQRRGIAGEGASDGAAALRALRERPFDVIISDVRMPGMSGREFLDRLRRERPSLVPRLVFSTGDTFAPDTAALLRDSGVPTVTKPFDFAELERVIRDVAARAAGKGPV